MKLPHCAWNENEDGVWETSCGDLFEFIESGPKDNKMKFCCYCGKKLVERKLGAPGNK